MSFSLKNYQGEASGFEPEVQFSAGHDRETNVLDEVKKSLKQVVDCVGGHVSVSACGHINEYDDQPGDSINLQVTSFLRTSDPTPDAGLEAAGGSARNFPPEASTAAPQPSDGSDPAPHQPVPQPDPTLPHSSPEPVSELAPISETSSGRTTTPMPSDDSSPAPVDPAGPTEPVVFDSTPGAPLASQEVEPALTTDPGSATPQSTAPPSSGEPSAEPTLD